LGRELERKRRAKLRRRDRRSYEALRRDTLSLFTKSGVEALAGESGFYQRRPRAIGIAQLVPEASFWPWWIGGAAVALFAVLYPIITGRLLGVDLLEGPRARRWAVSGACPGTALVQLGEGHLVALSTVVGIIIGAALHPLVNRRGLGWPSQSCD